MAEPSELFRATFMGAGIGSPVQECSCGRTVYSDSDCYDEGELERLKAQHEKNPKQYEYHADCDAVVSYQIMGRAYWEMRRLRTTRQQRWKRGVANRIYLYPWELASMDEYSTSVPSGTTPFKMWRRDLRSRITKEQHAQMERGQFRDEDWRVGQYYSLPDPTRIGIRWFEVVLLEGPEPAGYVSPDWSNYQRWLREAAAEREAEWRRQSPSFDSVKVTARELRARRIDG